MIKSGGGAHLATVGQSGGDPGPTGIVVRSECISCDVVVHWKATPAGPDQTDWEALDVPSSFACPHWSEHHEACFAALESKGGKGEKGQVSAEVLSRRN